jgi:NodT family efflux transporter outer membrane factor (OMF) lipoprotein
MSRSRFLAVGIAAVCVLALVGCSMTPTMPTPETEATLPSDYTQAAPDSVGADTLLPTAAADTARYDATRWWTDFRDPTLNALIDTALADNLTLAAARARLEELQAQYRIARAPLFPSADASGSVSRQSQPANTGIGGAIGDGGDDSDGGPSPQPTIDRFEFTDYSASLGLSYEIDFWGRVRSQKNAALSEFFATQADLHSTRLAIISQTISTYFQVVTLAEQVRLAQQNVDLLQERRDITRDRYNRGLATSFELYSVRQQYEQARANQPDLTSQFYDARSRLAVLLGRFAGQERALLANAGLDSLRLDAIPAGVPSDVLRQRPDVMATAARLEATRQQIGAARASVLPTVSLTGQGGLQSSSLENLFDPGQWFTSFMASLAQPLFRGGQLWAGIDASKARYEQQLATYEETLLTAFQEVKASLVAYEQQQQRYRRVADQLAAARASAQNQQRRYERGIGDYLALLDAEQNLTQVRQRFATARQAVIEARLAVHRALGGEWTATPAPEDPRLFQ